MVQISWLIDENMPADVIPFLRARGHIVYAVGETFGKSSPDSLLLAAAELNGLVVATFDNDFRQLIRQMPAGTRNHAKKQMGRISFKCREERAIARFQDLITVIEFQYQFAVSQNRRFIMQVSETSYTASM